MRSSPMTRGVLGAALCLVVVLAVAACGSSSSSGSSSLLSSASSPLVIADVQPPVAAGGPDFTSGMEVEADKLNKEGGVEGHKIELKILSVPGTPAGVVGGYRAAAADSSVIGTFVGDAGDELKPLGAELKLPALTATGTDSILQPTVPYIFSTTWGSQFATSSTVWALKQAKGKKIALIHYNFDFSQSIPSALHNLCKEKGCEIVDEEASTAEASVEQLTPQLEKMKASGADVYYIEGLNPNGFKAAKNLGMLSEGKPIASDQWLAVPAIATACGEDCNGAVFGGGKCRLNLNGFKELVQTEKITEFCKEYVKEWEEKNPGKEFAIYSIYGHDTVLDIATVVKNLLTAKKPVTRAALAEGLENLKGEPQTSQGLVTTHPGDHRLTATWKEANVNIKTSFTGGKLHYSLATLSEAPGAEAPESE